jgi:hypothetical protein
MKRHSGQAAAWWLAAGAMVATPALAQDTAAERVRHCTCLKLDLDDGRREIDLQGAMIDEREGELQDLTAQIDALRPTINPEDLAAVESFKRLLERQQALRTFLQRELRPVQTARVRKFNEAIEFFNGNCMGAVPKTIPANLQCSAFPDDHMKSR